MANGLEYSGYEGLAKLFYTQSISIDKKLHVIDCNRFIVAQALKKAPPERIISPPQFYPLPFTEHLKKLANPLNLTKNKYVLIFHASAKKSKHWELKHWQNIVKLLSEREIKVVLPWGTPEEKHISHLISSNIPNAIVPRAFTLTEAFTIIAQAKGILGVDTGLTHLSAALQKTTIEMYINCPSKKVEGYWGSNIFNLGDIDTPPNYEEVKSIVDRCFNLSTSLVVD